MNKHVFLSLFPESANKPGIQAIASAIDTLAQIQQTHENQVWWVNFWSFFKLGIGRQEKLADLRCNAQRQVADQVNILSGLMISEKIEHDRLTQQVMHCILKAFTAVIATKAEGKDLLLLNPTWQSWGNFIDSLAEKFPGITVEIAADHSRSRRVACPPPEKPKPAVVSYSPPRVEERRSSVTVRPGFKAGLR